MSVERKIAQSQKKYCKSWDQLKETNDACFRAYLGLLQKELSTPWKWLANSWGTYATSHRNSQATSIPS
jgi:hypothetical protein